MAVATVVNSGSSDTIYANPSANVFKGYGRDRSTGQDTIYEADSADTVDLSGYSSADVSETRSGDDLVLGLGSNGNITLKEYCLGRQPRISFSETPAPNEPPTATIAADPTSGTAPLSVDSDGSGSRDSDGSIISYAWDFGDGTGSSEATVQHSYANPGSYTAVLTVTDNQGTMGSATATIIVQQAPERVIRVGDLAMTVVAGARNGKAAQVVVTVTDLSGNAVEGSSVSGKWSGVINGATSGTAGSDGKVTLTSKPANKSGTVTFTVTGVSQPAGCVYDASQNVVSSISMAMTK